MNEEQENRLYLMVSRAMDNALANAQNGTNYKSWRINPAMKDQYGEDGKPRYETTDLLPASNFPQEKKKTPVSTVLRSGMKRDLSKIPTEKKGTLIEKKKVEKKTFSILH